MAFTSSFRKLRAEAWMVCATILMAFMTMTGYAMAANPAEQDGDQHGGRLGHVQRLIEAVSYTHLTLPTIPRWW